MSWMDDLNCIPENLPFDLAGPPIRRVATQAGYGGPIVGRSNPIGFIFDAIRGFCQPAAMREDGNGGYEDLSGMGASSPDLALPAEDQGLGFGVYGGGGGGFGFQGGGSSGGGDDGFKGEPEPTMPLLQPMIGMEPMQQCPAGASFQPALGFCVPDWLTGTMPAQEPAMEAFAPLGGGEGSCDKSPRNMARERLRQAVASCDQAGAEQVLAYAQGCLSSKKSGSSGADTLKLIAEAKAAIARITATCRQGQAAQAQSAMGAVQAMERPTRRPAFGRMPSPVTSLSLTEGNARMRASAEPMGGSIDPSKAATVPPRRRPGLGR